MPGFHPNAFNGTDQQEVLITAPVAPEASTELSPGTAQAVELPEYLSESLRELGNTIGNVAGGNTGALTSQISMAKANIEAAMAKAESLGIPTTGIDLQALDNFTGASDTVDPKTLSLMIENAMRAVSEGEKLIAQVTQSELVQGLVQGASALAGTGALGSFSLAGHEALKHVNIESAMGGMRSLFAGLNALEKGADGTMVANYAGIVDQFIPQQGLPNLIGDLAKGIS